MKTFLRALFAMDDGIYRLTWDEGLFLWCLILLAACLLIIMACKIIILFHP